MRCAARRAVDGPTMSTTIDHVNRGIRPERHPEVIVMPGGLLYVLVCLLVLLLILAVLGVI